MQTPRYDIHVFEPKLNMTLYAHTYLASSPEAAKELFLAKNPHRQADMVSVVKAEKL